MKICARCGHSVGFIDRFKVNFDKKPMLPCSNCGAELLNKDKLLSHSIVTGIIVVASLYLGGLLDSELLEFVVAVGIPTVYFVVFLPLNTKR
ncbi:hypothetical protein [Microbulbifer sp. THAF38]|uniref:hypothetical protein n=1 Tax=Microbulbifer sp. THAF38 TaxID=2587856 RepID=UPI00126825BA|nr:hypothetical protein [Microbulbifer sp. THAF38]QFT56719.1 hypothetical protein FIU95_19395 [Microbulbifer sp. THAF38]